METPQLALIGLSSSLHAEACNAVGASDGVIHSSSTAAPPSSPQTSPSSSSQTSSAALTNATPNMELRSRRAKDELNRWAALEKPVDFPTRLSFNACYDGASVLASDLTLSKQASA